MLYSELNKLSISELQQLQEKVRRVIQDKQVDSLQDIVVGSKVRVNHRKATGVYTVVKMNRKTYVLENENGSRVKASIGLLSAA